MNMDRFLDFLIAVNADMLTHAGTEGNFEGADEAAKVELPSRGARDFAFQPLVQVFDEGLSSAELMNVCLEGPRLA